MMSAPEQIDTPTVSPGKSETSEHSVDYYYLEAMRYLSCSDHHDSDSEAGDCTCRACRGEADHGDSRTSLSSLGESLERNDEDTLDGSGGRERSWSHSRAQEIESGTISQLPDLSGKLGGERMKTRRYSDGMLLKPMIKVQWADECKKELTRTRPRKTYTRNPSLKPPKVKSILKHSSDENLYVSREDFESDHEDTNAEEAQVKPA